MLGRYVSGYFIKVINNLEKNLENYNIPQKNKLAPSRGKLTA